MASLLYVCACAHSSNLPYLCFQLVGGDGKVQVGFLERPRKLDHSEVVRLQCRSTGRKKGLNWERAELGRESFGLLLGPFLPF